MTTANPLLDCYRSQIVRAVTGNRPAIVFHVTDETALMRICERLVEAERAAEILQHKGYGKPSAGMTLDEVAASIPDRE